MTAPEHTSKKYQKYARQLLKATPVSLLRETLDDPIRWYEQPDILPEGIPPITDRATVAFLMHGNYRALAEALCLDGKPAESLDYTYLSAAAVARAHQLWRTEKVNNPAVENDIRHGRGTVDAICGLIAVNAWEEAAAFAKSAEPLYYALLTDDDQTAQQITAHLPDTPPKDALRHEVYFTGVIFCKAIFQALLDRDEVKLRNALLTRVMQYRGSMWDYSTVIDRVSIAVTKLAERRKVYGTAPDIAEVPRIYLDANTHASQHLPKMLEN